MSGLATVLHAGKRWEWFGKSPCNTHLWQCAQVLRYGCQQDDQDPALNEQIGLEVTQHPESNEQPATEINQQSASTEQIGLEVTQHPESNEQPATEINQQPAPNEQIDSQVTQHLETNEQPETNKQLAQEIRQEPAPNEQLSPDNRQQPEVNEQFAPNNSVTICHSWSTAYFTKCIYSGCQTLFLTSWHCSLSKSPDKALSWKEASIKRCSLCLRGLAVACWTTYHYHPSSNLGVGISEGCFIFDFASLHLEVARPI